MKILSAIALMAIFALSGCAAVDNLYPPPNKITESVDKDGNPVKITEPAYRQSVDTGGFFESANLKNFYTYQSKRSDNHKESAENKVAAINSNAIKAAEKAAANKVDLGGGKPNSSTSRYEAALDDAMKARNPVEYIRLLRQGKAD